MSSYITFYFVKKDALKKYREEKARIDALPGTHWTKDYSSLREIMKDRIMLFYQSSSGELYRFFKEQGEYDNYTILTNEMVNDAIQKANEYIQMDKEKIEFYEKYGTFSREAIEEGSYKNALDFLEKLPTLIDKRFSSNIEELKKIVLQAQKKENSDEDNDEESWYEEYKESLADYETALGLLQSLDYISDQKSDNSDLELVFYYD